MDSERSDAAGGSLSPLTRADFFGATLSKVDLTGVDLSEVDLSGALLGE
jgi:uncharacterized protein YjbI with pentapeptide repeats